MGGTSLINCGFYSRGNKQDFQRWSDLLNDTTWNYEHLLPYFTNLENFTRENPYAPIDINYHGYEGPLHTSQCKPPQKISAKLAEASYALGYNIIDYNGRQQLGGSIFQFFIKNGKRFDPAMAFIDPIKSRENLVILDRSYVTKIKIDQTTKQVEGVIFTRNNKTYIARNHKEVILSAGAISSPQILMLSGIGPQKHLKSMGIPVVQNLPVGENLIDHVLLQFPFSSNASSKPETLEESVRDLLRGKGALTRSFVYDAVSWLKTSSEPKGNYPSVEFALNNISSSNLIQKYMGWTDETYNAMNPNVSSPLAIAMIICHPKSKGTVRLKSSDPFEYPLIDANFLGDEEDMETNYQGIQTMLKLAKTKPFKAINVTLALDQFPGCNHTQAFTKEFWYCFLRRTAGPGYHPVSTCRTSKSPKTGVVDSKLKVFGVNGLRIADASVIPFPFANHPNALCNVIGAKVSDIIKKFYRI